MASITTEYSTNPNKASSYSYNKLIGCASGFQSSVFSTCYNSYKYGLREYYEFRISFSSPLLVSVLSIFFYSIPLLFLYFFFLSFSQLFFCLHLFPSCLWSITSFFSILLSQLYISFVMDFKKYISFVMKSNEHSLFTTTKKKAPKKYMPVFLGASKCNNYGIKILSHPNKCLDSKD